MSLLTGRSYFTCEMGVVSLGDLAANGTREISSEVLESTSPAVD